MQFLADWIEDALNASAEERATMCELKIMVGDDNASSHWDVHDRYAYEAVTVPTVHLAEGIATDWWSIFGGRDKQHPIAPYRTGFILPCLSFKCDGSTFEILGEQMDCENPGLRFWKPDNEVIPRCDAERALSDFVEKTIQRLVMAGIDDAEVQFQWSRISESRQDPEQTAFCEAAGALGVNPFTIDEWDEELILEAGEIFNGTSLVDFLAGVATLEDKQRRSTLRSVRNVDRQMGEESRLPHLREAACEVDDGFKQQRPNEGAWGPGYRVARALRQTLDMPESRPFESVTHMAKMLGCERFGSTDRLPGINAVVSRHDDIHIHLASSFHGAWWSDSFNFARAVGDAVCFPGGGLSVVNGLHGAERQAMGRAFAAEFLAPVGMVALMNREGLDHDEIAGRFAVSPQVIQRQLENRGRIEMACT
ncbi:MAG: hypothetical protein OXD31_08750 [Chloroflexi bacterium]|nr:hypothetical protein [Chloroflexota bacterium]